MVYEVINILLFLMGISGPTQVAGMRGTTAAFLSGSNNSAVVGHAVAGAPRGR